jgi:hypothetical protein|nr:MAG TPA: hypothetical protein [Caudoviricetes sp.]
MQYMAHINENGIDRMAEIDTLGNVTQAANEIIGTANIREGAEVLIAWTIFDFPSKRFAVNEYRFTVEDGMAKGIARA